MNRTIKRSVTITITETWTIVWTDADDPLPSAPVTAAEAPTSEGEAQAVPKFVCPLMRQRPGEAAPVAFANEETDNDDT